VRQAPVGLKNPIQSLWRLLAEMGRSTTDIERQRELGTRDRESHMPRDRSNNEHYVLETLRTACLCQSSTLAVPPQPLNGRNSQEYGGHRQRSAPTWSPSGAARNGSEADPHRRAGLDVARPASNH